MPSQVSTPPEWDQILSAAQKNNVSEIQRLVTQEGVSANHANSVGQSALHVSALWGHVEAVQTLISLGANPTAQNQINGASPLHCTVQSSKNNLQNRVECAKLLVQAPETQRKANITPSPSTSTSTTNASSTANAVLHANNSADVVNIPDLYGLTALDYIQNEEYQSKLAKFDGEANTTDFLQSMKQVLLQAGGQETESSEIYKLVKAVDWNGLKEYCGKYSREDMNMLRHSLGQFDTLSGFTPFLLAIDDIQNLLLEGAGAGGNNNSSEGGTDTADVDNELVKRIKIVELLLKHGSEVDVCSKDEENSHSTSLYKICEALSTNYMLSGNDLESTNQKKEAFDVCSSLEQMALLLIKYGAKLSPKVSRLMHDAARRGNIRTVQFWIEGLGISPNYQGRQGLTVLHFACRSGRSDIVGYLLSIDYTSDNGGNSGSVVDINMKDVSGKTAMDYAIINKKPDIVDMLQSVQSRGK